MRPIRLYAVCACLLLLTFGAATPPPSRAQTTDEGKPDQFVLVPEHSNGSLRAASGDNYLSPATAAARPFTHMLLRWQATLPGDSAMQLAVRASSDGSIWTRWVDVQENDDLWMDSDGPNVHWSAMIDAGFSARFWQVRGSFTPASSGALPELRRIDVNTVDANAATPQPHADGMRTNAVISKPGVVSRTAWGNPDGQSSRVPPDYYPVNHMVVHHTADSSTLLPGEPNWAARVRAEWSFHTFTRGWGDVGYNFLIDPNGVIYEGRAGGDDAVAFHDTANYGSMGVVIIGTYSDTQPTGAAQNSLVRLLSWKAAQKRIDPLGRSYYYGCAISKYCYPSNPGGVVLNIAGHRQVTPGHTSCPGDGLLALLPGIRNQVKQALDGSPSDNGDLEIDELETGFARSNTAWRDAACGDGGHTYYSYATDTPAESTNSATWRPNIPASTTYRVFVHIPQSCGLGSPPYASTKALYRIHSADGDFTRAVDQNSADAWIDIGIYRFNAGTDGAVELNDLTGEPFSSKRVLFFDAVKWVPEDASTNVALTNVSYDTATVPAGGLLHVNFTVKNIGSTPLYSQAPQIDPTANGGLNGSDNGYVYDQDECFLGDQNGSYPAFPKESGRFRVALNLVSANPAGSSRVQCSGNSSYAWRWGLNSTLNPGEQQTISGYVRFRVPGQYTLAAGVIQEYVKYYVDGVNSTTITVTPEQMAPDVAAFDGALRPTATVYKLGTVPDNLLARTSNSLSVPRGAYVGSFAWDGSFTDWGNGGPLGLTDGFLVEQTRSFVAPVAGVYTFLTSSDDGSWLWVDGQTVVDNHGLHAASNVTGTVQLSAGIHRLSFKYFDRSGPAAAGYAMRVPGATSAPNASTINASNDEDSGTLNGFGVIYDPLGAGTPRVDGVFAAPPRLALAADDQGGEGVNRMRVQINDGPWQDQLTSLVQLGSDTFPNGSYRVRYSAVDSAGNISPVREASFKVDSTLPLARTFLPLMDRP